MKKIILAVLMLSVLAVKTHAGFNFGITNAVKKQAKELDNKIEKANQAEIAKYPKWTIMVYMSGDNNLEASAVEDLIEIANVGSTPNINVVVQFDRNPEYSADPILNIPNWTTAKRFYVKQGSLEEKQDLGEVNMASLETLSNFIQWSTTNYPANKYVLVFWDHGSSWSGFGTDETSDKVNDEYDLLTLEEIDSAMLEATQKMGITKFDLIGFDACLQADIQTLHIMKQYGKVYVGSEEIEPGSGWQYDQILTYLKNNLNTTPQDLGRKIADSYKASFDQVTDMKNEGLGITLSVIDLEKVAVVETALNGLASALKQFTAGETVAGNRDNWLKIAKSKENTQNFGSDDVNALDIYHLARNLMDNTTEVATITTDDMVRQRAYDCMSAIDNAVLYRINGTNRTFGYGISVYYPPYQDKYKPAYENISFSVMNLWADYLSNYLDIESKDTTAPSIDFGADEETINPNDPADVVICTTTITSVNDFDVAQVNFTLGETWGSGIIVLGNIDVPVNLDDVTPSGANFDLSAEMSWGGEWFAIADKTNIVLAPFNSFDYVGVDKDENKIYYAQMSAQYLPAGGTDWNTEASTITLSFSVILSTDSYEWKAGEYIAASEPSDTGPTPIKIKSGDKIKPICQIITGGGEIEVPYSTSITIDAQGLELGLMPVPAGDYKIGFSAVDYCNHWDADYADIEVQ